MSTDSMDSASLPVAVAENNLSTRFKKHSAAIQMSNTSISLVQRKLYNCLLFNASENLLTSSTHKISVQELIEMLRYEGSKNYEYIAQNVQALMSTTVTWSLLDEKDKDAFGKSVLLSAIRVRGGVVEYEFSRALSEKLAQPRVYGIIDWSIQSVFKSKYSLALYENAARYLDDGVSAPIPFETFRELLGAPSTYEYKEFNRHCIAPAVKECNEHSDLLINVEPLREGRRIYAVRLHVAVNPVRMAIVDEVMKSTKDVEEALIRVGINAIQAKNFCSLYSPEYLREKLDVLAEQQATPAGVKNPPGLLRRAIERDFKPSNVASKPAPEQPAQPSQPTVFDVKERAEQASREEERRKLTEDRRKFDDLPDAKKEEVLESFGKYLSGANTLLLQAWRKQRMQSPLVNSAFIGYLREYHPEALEGRD